MAPSYSKLLVLVPLMLMSIGMITTPIAMGLTQNSSQNSPSNQGTIIGKSTIVVNGTTYPLIIYQVPPNPAVTPAPPRSTPFPPTTVVDGSVSPMTSSFWQYGAQWGPSSTYYGADMTFNYFDSQSSSTPGFSYWLGITDNSASCTNGCFYQAGLTWTYNAGLCYSYTGWSIDSYSDPSLSFSPCWPLQSGVWSATGMTSGSETIYIFLYNGQWYSDFTGSPEGSYAPSGANAFPGGADSATKVVGPATAATEGSSTSFGNNGEDLASQFQYVTAVSYSGGTFGITVTDAISSISNYYQASGTGFITPPSTANWYVAGTCPYTYESYFYSGGPGLPSSSTLSAC